MKNTPTRINLRLATCYWAFLLIFAAASSLLRAQESNATQEYLTINSRPSGAVVHLDGEYQFIGRTPFVVPYMVIGEYSVKASKLGYNNFSRDVTFSGSLPNTFEIKLMKKSRAKALSRSIAAPGWGQYYSDRKTTGAVWGAATAVAVVSLIKTQYEYSAAYRDYESSLAKADLGGLSYSERLGIFGEVDDAWRNLEKKTDSRDLNIYILAGIWLTNIIDSYIFFPDYGNEIEVFQKFSLNASARHDGLSFHLQYSLN
ncbi:PEGA domain-containing protein [candidate division KSB1 bacterium]|nr:PEGA domain-containing protein [candidate division KSB1 bacterium]